MSANNSSEPILADGVKYVHGMDLFRRNPWFGNQVEQLLGENIAKGTRVEQIGEYWFIVSDDVWQQVIKRIDKYYSAMENVI